MLFFQLEHVTACIWLICNMWFVLANGKCEKKCSAMVIACSDPDPCDEFLKSLYNTLVLFTVFNMSISFEVWDDRGCISFIWNCDVVYLQYMFITLYWLLSGTKLNINIRAVKIYYTQCCSWTVSLPWLLTWAGWSGKGNMPYTVLSCSFSLWAVALQTATVACS